MIHESTTPAAALRWAEFSGDFNPIHFDPARAALAGSDRLIVHGMLALLHVKDATMRALGAAVPTVGWSRFKALFRSPIPQASPLELTVAPKGEAVRFTLGGDGREYARGLHEASQPALSPAGAQPDCAIDPGIVRAQLAKFESSFASQADAWIFLDALVFGQFLEQRFAQLKEMSPDIVAVQVSHSVACDAERLRMLFANAARLPHVGYSLRGENRSAQARSESGVAQLDVFADGELVMQIEIGLLARAGTQSQPSPSTPTTPNP